jgi:hypothetical protein
MSAAGVSMDPLEEPAKALADRIRRAFEPSPVPTWPELLGIDPLGDQEYAAFVGVHWCDVPAQAFRSNGYDLPPVFLFPDHPRIWNYYLPGFLKAALLHEGAELPIVATLMGRLRDLERPAAVRAGTPWWGGDTYFANYAPEQIACVAAFVQLVRDQGEMGRLGFMWEAEDDVTLQRWCATNG